MKCVVFILFLFPIVYLRANDSLVFTATVKVLDIQSRRPIPDVSVCLSNDKGESCWKGCTDTSGSVYIGQGKILPNSHYRVTIEHPAFYYDPVGVTISTDSLHFSQHFELVMSFLPLKHCSIMGCFELDALKTPTDLVAFVTALKYWKTIFEQEYDLEQGITVMYVHTKSDTYHKSVRRVSRKIMHLYHWKYPGDPIRRKPVYSNMKAHGHPCCITPGVIPKDRTR